MIRYILTVGVVVATLMDVIAPEWAVASRTVAVSVNLLWIWSGS